MTEDIILELEDIALKEGFPYVLDPKSIMGYKLAIKPIKPHELQQKLPDLMRKAAERVGAKFDGHLDRERQRVFPDTFYFECRTKENAREIEDIIGQFGVGYSSQQYPINQN